MRRLIVCTLFGLLATGAYCQESWKLKREQDGIRVFTTSVDGSSLKKVKVACTIDATLSQLVALLMDASAHEQWVYNTRHSYLVRQADARHQRYYSETSLPWPMANRDVVVDMVVEQDPLTKAVKVYAHSTTDDNLPAKKGIVRVPMTQVNWSITPAGAHSLQVEYTAQADPGGSIPSWLVNAFLTKGPMESFLKLRELVKTAPYEKSQYAFIQN